MSKTSEYTGKYNLPTVKRGDTIEGFQITVASEDVPVIPDEVCAQLRDKNDALIHAFGYEIDPLTGEVEIAAVPGSITASFPVGTLYYDIEYIFVSSGRNKTYLEGQINIVKDVSRCGP